MAKLAELSPISLESFGVAGLLSEDCKVFYESLFSLKHLGRVSDLLSARLRQEGADELRLRAVLLFGLFSAYRSDNSPTAEEVLADPIVIECGIDFEKVAVGIKFKMKGEWPNDPHGISARIKAGLAAGAFERFLADFHAHADQVVLRLQPDLLRIEVVALMGMPADAAYKFGTDFSPIGVAVLPAQSVEMAKAANYIELGDLDYSTLLLEDNPRMAIVASPMGELLAAIIRDPGELTEILRKYGCGDQPITDDLTQVSGNNVESGNDDVLVVKGAVEHGALSRPKLSSGKSLLRKIWPFGKSSVKPEQQEIVKDVAVSAETNLHAGPGVGMNLEAVVNSFVVEIQSGSLDRTLSKARLEVKELKKDVSSVRAGRWMDGLMGELVVEKARLYENAKQLGLSIRQKELEFQTKEHRLLDELRRHDELLRQKTFALGRNQDQIASLTAALNKVKSDRTSTSEDAHYKSKWEFVQKLLFTSKEENTQLASKVVELRHQLVAAQHQAVKRGGSSSKDLLDLQNREERAMRRVEEYRRVNQELLRKLAVANKRDRSGSGAGDELRNRLEAAAKQISTSQKEIETLNTKLERLTREEQRLKQALLLAHEKLTSRKAG